MSIAVIPRDRAHLPTALAVTGLAIDTYLLATRLPLPLVNAGHSFAADLTQASRLSPVALGGVPWLSAVLLTELAALALPARLTTRVTRNGHGDPFATLVHALTLLLAALQANGIATALSAVPNLLLDSSSLAHVVIMVTLVAGVALTIALAGLVERTGIGHGFWTFSALIAVFQAIGEVRTHLGLAGLGLPSPAALVATLAAWLILPATVIALVEVRRRSGLASLAPLILAPFLGGLVGGLVIAVTMSLVTIETDTPALLVQGAATTLGSLAVVALYTKREGFWPLFAPTTALLIALLAVLPLVDYRLYAKLLPFSVAYLVLLIAVGYPHVRSWSAATPARP